MPKTVSTLCSVCGQTVRLAELGGQTNRLRCPSCGAVVGTRKDIHARTAADGLMMFGAVNGRPPGATEWGRKSSKRRASRDQSLTRPEAQVLANMALSHKDASGPEILKLLFHAYERAYSLACREHPPADESADLDLRKKLAELVLEAYAEGEDDPAMLEEIVMIRLRSQNARI